MKPLKGPQTKPVPQVSVAVTGIGPGNRGPTLSFKIDRSETVQQLKKRVSSQIQVPAAQLHIFFKNQELGNEKSVVAISPGSQQINLLCKVVKN